MKQKSAAERVSYLKAALKINPTFEAEELLTLRDRYHVGPKKAGASTTEEKIDLNELREETNAEITLIRNEFWQMNLSELKQRLAALQLEKFPDLRNAAERLGTMALNRHLIPQLSQDKDFDPKFFAMVKEILIMSPRESGELKEQLQSKLRSKPVIKRVTKMLKLIDRELPDVYDLEEEWFSILKKMKPKVVTSKMLADSQSEQSTSDTDWGSMGWIIWVIVVIAIKVLLRMTRD